MLEFLFKLLNTAGMAVLAYIIVGGAAGLLLKILELFGVKVPEDKKEENE